jgi:fructokinase
MTEGPEASGGSGRRPLILGAGEALWDVFPGERLPGGAPFNVACHARALGCRAGLVSRVGRDGEGEALIRFLCCRGVGTAELQRDPVHPTGRVTVSLGKGGAPRYSFRQDTAWDHLAWRPSLQKLAAAADGVCFGSLAQRGPVSRATLQRFIAATRPDCWRLFDVNLRRNFYSRRTLEQSLEQAGALKLNGDELKVFRRLFRLKGDDAACLRLLAERFGLKVVALTRGGRGCLVWNGERMLREPAARVRVVDSVGAGDAFAAVLLAGLCLHHPLATVLRHAARVAGYVCSQRGATPVLPASFCLK